MADETKELKTSADLLKELNEIKSGLENSMEQKADARIDEKLIAVNSAIEELKNVKPEVTSEELKSLRDDLSATIRQVDMVDIRTKRGVSNQPAQEKSFDQVLKEALVENQDKIKKMSLKDEKREKSFSIDLDMKAVGDVSLTNYTGGTRGITALRPGIITNPNRKVHMRDIIPTGTIGPGTEYVFMKENGIGEGAIAPTAEGAFKPQFDLDLIEASVKIETIAGWMRVTRKAMNNILGFTSFLQMRLPQLMLGVEDAQVLNGDGVSPNLKGIQTAGNFTAATSLAAAIDIEQLVLGIGQLDGMNRNTSFIVLNTADYYNLLLNKAAGSGEYDLPKVITVDENGVLRILGISVIQTTAQTAGTYLIGDSDGVQLLFQENMRIEFFEQDGTNVRENKITVRIEETVALPVYGSTYFVKGTF